MTQQSINDIYSKVNTIATANTDKVIRNVIKEITHRGTCDQCSYPQNAEEYEKLLSEYISLKIKITKLWRQMNHQECYHLNWEKPSCSYINKLEDESDRVRVNMVGIEPCDECKEKYNPNGSKKYRERNKPLILDERTFLNYE